MTSSPYIVLLGVGEMGGVFARGFLRAGLGVFPVTRQMDPVQVAAQLPAPELVLVAVAEADLQSVLSQLPDAWRDRLVLLQNELLPQDWRQHDLAPTVISVWFEKKPGMDAKVIVPSPVFGPKANRVAEALGAIGIATEVLADADTLLFELVRKNLYILTSNIAGLKVGGTVGQLRDEHGEFMRTVAADILAIQESLVGAALDADALIKAMRLAFDGDPEHKCMGRSAPARLARALQQADAAGLDAPSLREIAAQT